MTTPAPLAIGAHRDFFAGRVVISVTRTAADAYRVVVIAQGGHAIDCYTNELTAERIPMGTSVRRAAWEYMQCLARDFGADLETPAGVAARYATAA